MADKQDAINTSCSTGNEPGAPSATLKPTALELTEYRSNHPRRGKAIIINQRNFHPRLQQSEREGTDVDAEALADVFQHLGFDVERYDNLTSTDMSMTMRRISKEDHTDADCFACIILSHGEEGRVFSTDGRVYIEHITKNFKGDECPTLAGKPKLFFIQACRGSKFDWGVEVDEPDAAIEGPSLRKIPMEADFLMAYSVVPGYFSWRNNIDGSWFIQALCRVFQQHGATMELTNMMTLINKVVAFDFESCTDEEFTSNMKQVPCFASTLTKLVFFRSK